MQPQQAASGHVSSTPSVGNGGNPAIASAGTIVGSPQPCKGGFLIKIKTAKIDKILIARFLIVEKK